MDLPWLYYSKRPNQIIFLSKKTSLAGWKIAVYTTDIGSDNSLVMAKNEYVIESPQEAENSVKRFDVDKFHDDHYTETFKL